jgi:type II secretory pathway component PulL
MADENIKVKVAAQRALVSFLLSIEDQAILDQFKSLTQQILNVTVEALKVDETLGQ